jgi:hypothetical protein
MEEMHEFAERVAKLPTELPKPKQKQKVATQNVSSEGHRKPATGYAPGDGMWETTAFAKRRAKSRVRNKLAKAAKRKNRK